MRVLQRYQIPLTLAAFVNYHKCLNLQRLNNQALWLSDHRMLHLRLNIDCTFVEPQHIVVTKKFLFRFKYDKSKVEKY